MDRVNQDADDELIGFDPDIKIKRGYVYMPYTVPRIKRIFKEVFNAELIWCNGGYKADRSPFYVRKYRGQDINTKEVLFEGITMEQIRRFLAKNDYPLFDEKSIVNTAKPKRNMQAVRFLRAVAKMKEKKK
jgi:hypothetical protein